MFRPVLAIIRLSDDGQHRPKHVVVSMTVIKYTSVIKLFDYIPSPSFTHTTGMTHFLDVLGCYTMWDYNLISTFQETLHCDDHFRLF